MRRDDLLDTTALVDPKLALMQRTATRLMLHEEGQASVDAAFDPLVPAFGAIVRAPECPTCGAAPCVNPSFCAKSREADRKFSRRRENPDIARVRRLLDDSISIERAYAEMNDARRQPLKGDRGVPFNKAERPRTLSQPAIRLANLAEAIERARSLLGDGSTEQRIRILWGAAKRARALGTSEQVSREFMKLAVEVNLIDRHGRWTGDDVRDTVRRHGKEDVAHVISWAMRGMNPFGTGPLK